MRLTSNVSAISDQNPIPELLEKVIKELPDGVAIFEIVKSGLLSQSQLRLIWINKLFKLCRLLLWFLRTLIL